MTRLITKKKFLNKYPFFNLGHTKKETFEISQWITAGSEECDNKSRAIPDSNLPYTYKIDAITHTYVFI